MNPLKRIGQHLAASWKHHFSLQIATVLVLTAGFAVVCGVLVIGDNMHRIFTLWGESMQMSVYFNDTATDSNIANVQKYIDDSGKFEVPKYVSKDEALKSFREQIASYAPDLLNDREIMRFMPVSLQLGIRHSVSVADHLQVLQTAAAGIQGLPGVEDVSYGQEWVKSYSSIMGTLNWGGLGFIFILIASALFVMANSISSSIAQRRSEVEVLELIGATARYIRAPFLAEGALLGAATSLMAILVTAGLYSATKNLLHAQIALLQVADHLQFLSFAASVALVLGGAIMGLGSAWLCVRRINTGWAASRNE